MLSAISSASYKSSFEPENLPREEPEILKDLYKTEGEISRLLSTFGKTYCDEDPHTLDLDAMLHEMDRLKIQLPALCENLDDLEEELCNARYEPEPEDQ